MARNEIIKQDVKNAAVDSNDVYIQRISLDKKLLLLRL